MSSEHWKTELKQKKKYEKPLGSVNASVYRTNKHKQTKKNSSMRNSQCSAFHCDPFFFSAALRALLFCLDCHRIWMKNETNKKKTVWNHRPNWLWTGWTVPEFCFRFFFSFRQFHFRHDRSCFMRARAIERLMREENDVEINFTSTILGRTHIAHPTDRLFVLTWSTCLGLSPLFRWWTNAWNGKSPNHSENEILIRLKLKF